MWNKTHLLLRLRAVAFWGILFGAAGHLYWLIHRSEESNEVVDRPDANAQSIFAVRNVRSAARPDGEWHEIQVLLENQTNQSVAVLGANKACNKWGCFQIESSPQNVEPGKSFWLVIQAKWVKVPEAPFKVKVFTSRSLTSSFDLEVLPESVTIAQPKVLILDEEMEIP